MRGPTDKDLVSAARTGDQAAYGELFERYQSRIYNYAYGIVGNAEDARDVAQDAFIRVFEALPRKSDDLNFSAYVYRTAHNVAVDSARARSKFSGPDALDLEHEPALRADPEKVALLKEQQEQTWRAVFDVPDKQREILALRELHDMSYQEIANVLELPRNTVGVLLSRARLKFKEAFRMTSIDIDKLTEECQGILPLLSARIDDELASNERERVEEHLEKCAFCRLALEEMTEASASLRGLMPLLPPAALHDNVHANIANLLSPEEAYGAELSPRKLSSRRMHIVSGAIATAVVVGALVAMLVWSTTTGDVKTPNDPVLPVTVEETASLDASDTTAEDPVVSADEAQDDTDESDSNADDSASSSDSDTEAPPTPSQVSPTDGTTVRKSSVTLTWDPVDDPSGVTYVVQIETWDEDSDSYVADSEQQVESATLTHSVSSRLERWRVRAVDDAGNKSAFSGWWRYKVYRVVTPPQVDESDDPDVPY